MFKTILEEMFKGNFSFLILAIGIIQTILLIISLKKTSKK